MAHEEAIGKRLQYTVTLQAPGTIVTQWTKAGIGVQTERTVPLPDGIQFLADTRNSHDAFNAGRVWQRKRGH